MPNQTDHNDPKIREAVAQALMDDTPVKATAAGPGAAAAAVPNPKELFCKNWDTVKQVLQFLKPYLPKNLQGIIDTIIKVGDTLKRLIC